MEIEQILAIVGITVLSIFFLILFIVMLFNHKKEKKEMQKRQKLILKAMKEPYYITKEYKEFELKFNEMAQANKDLIEWMENKK